MPYVVLAVIAGIVYIFEHPIILLAFFGILALIIFLIVFFVGRKTRKEQQRAKEEARKKSDYSYLTSVYMEQLKNKKADLSNQGSNQTLENNQQDSLYEHIPVTVTGVTFSNGRRQRQTILRQIYWKDAPYDKQLNVTLRQGEYEGQPTMEVWVNDEQIGFVPKAMVPFFVQNTHRFHSISNFKVYGGGQGKSYGASFTARFLKDEDN